MTKTVSYSYDYANRWIGETITIPGETGDTITQTRYVYDGNQIVAQFDKTGTGDLASTDLSHRYLWDAQAVDHLFADEQVTNLNDPGSVLYTLTDHENSIRDLATYNSGTDTTTVANHRIFDSYGNLDSQTNAAVDCLFGYTGRAYDEATGLQNNLNRWYEAITGRWLSQDPIGFGGGDANLYRYVGNDPLGKVDPSGLDPAFCPTIGLGSPWYNPMPSPPTVVLKGRWEMSIRVYTGDAIGHAWIYLKNLDTGLERTVASHKAGTMGDPGTGTIWDKDLNRLPHHAERTVRVCNPRIQVTNDYTVVGNTCASYALRIWNENAPPEQRMKERWDSLRPAWLARQINPEPPDHDIDYSDTTFFSVP